MTLRYELNTIREFFLSVGQFHTPAYKVNTFLTKELDLVACFARRLRPYTFFFQLLAVNEDVTNVIFMVCCSAGYKKHLGKYLFFVQK